MTYWVKAAGNKKTTTTTIRNPSVPLWTSDRTDVSCFAPWRSLRVEVERRSSRGKVVPEKLTTVVFRNRGLSGVFRSRFRRKPRQRMTEKINKQPPPSKTGRFPVLFRISSVSRVTRPGAERRICWK